MKSQLQVIGLILLTACNFLLFYRIVKSSSNSFPLLRSYLRANDTSYDLNGNPNNPPAVEEDSTKTGKLVPNGMPKRTIEAKDLSECDRCKLDLPPVLTDKWMTISMPKKSYFRFDAPMDELKWKQAACSAACGEQVLLKKIMKLFPTGKEFLNGETSFRQWQHLINIFMNKITSFQPLLHDKSKFNPLPAEEQVVTSEQAKYIKELLPPPDSIYKETDQFYPVLTAGFPFIKLGSTSYSDSYFQGRESFGGYYISLEKFISMWRANKDNIRTPFVVMYVNNENWGWLSTFFPNRTAPWGFDEDGLQQNVYEFLDHPMTVGLITNQHHNYSHPKIIPLPLGLAGNDKVKAALYTAMQRSVLNTTKHNLLLSSSSNWGPRKCPSVCLNVNLSNH